MLDEKKVMTMRKLIIGGILVCFLFLMSVFFWFNLQTESIPILSAGGDEWIIDGDTVYINNSRIYASVTPHTVHDFSEYIETNFTSKIYGGPMYVVYGFNTTEMKPTDSDLWNPQNITWNESHEYFFFNVSNIEQTSEDCIIGDEDSLYRRNVSYQELLLNEEDEEVRENAQAIVCFDSYEQDGNYYIIYWTTNHWEMQYWSDFAENWESYDHNYGGMNKWYYKQVSIEANKSYKIRIDMRSVPALGEISGKYWQGFYPEIGCSGPKNCLIEAIDNDRLYYIDPWWNTSFDKCKNINITSADAVTLTNFPAYINVTYDSDMLSDYSDIRFVNNTCNNDGTELDYEIENYTATEATTWVRIPTLVAPVTEISMYYDNQTPVVDGQNPTGVWDNYYKAVYHLKDSTDGAPTQTEDSTIGANLCSDDVGTPDETAGLIARGQNFEGADFFGCGTNPSVKLEMTGDIALSSWINMNAVFGVKRQHGVVWTYHYREYRLQVDSLTRQIKLLHGNGTAFEQITSDAALGGILDTAGVWYKIDTIRNNVTRNITFYVDGEQLGAQKPFTMNFFSVGAHQLEVGYAGLYANATLDEVRLSSTNRSAEWVRMSYQIQKNQDTWVTFGEEQTEEVVGDTCDCSSIQGGTPINCGENCTITENCDVGGTNILFSGAGYIDVTHNITNYGDVTLANGCEVTTLSSGGFR